MSFWLITQVTQLSKRVDHFINGLVFILTYDVTHCDDKVYWDERSILTQYNCNNVTVKDEDSQSPFFSWKHNMFIQKREWKCTKKHCIYSIFPSLRSAAVPIPWKLLGYTLLHPDPGANWCCTLGGSCKVCKYEQHQKTRLRWKAQMWWKELELLRVKQNFWPILFFPSISGEISFSAFLLAPLYRVATLVKTFQAKDTIEDIWTTEVLPDLSEQSCLLLCTKIQDKQ